MAQKNSSVTLMKRMRYITIGLVGMGVIALISLGSIAYLLFGTTPPTPDAQPTQVAAIPTPPPCPIDSTTNTLTYQGAGIQLPNTATDVYSACEGTDTWAIHVRFDLSPQAFEEYLGTVTFNGDGNARYVADIAGYDATTIQSSRHFLQEGDSVFEILVDTTNEALYRVYMVRQGTA